MPNRIVLPEKSIPIRGLVLSCKCGKSVAPEEYKNGMCLDCNATKLCAPYRAEIARLYRKKLRYDKKGLPTKGSDDIAHRNRVRIIKVCQGLTSNVKRLEELANEQGRLAREAVSTSKILIPGR